MILTNGLLSLPFMCHMYALRCRTTEKVLQISQHAQGGPSLTSPPDQQDVMREAFILRRLDDGSDRTVDEKAAFLQSWVFFAALTEAWKPSGLDMEVGDFLATMSGDLVVSTACLHTYGGAWAEKESALGPDGRDDRVSTVFRIVRDMEYFLSRWTPEGLRDDDGPSRSWEVIRQIFFSAAVVCRFLRITSTRIFSCQARTLRTLIPWQGNYMLGWSYDTAKHRAREFMRPEGQCRSEALMVREVLVDAPSIFLYYLQRPSLTENHKHCTDEICKAQEV